MQISNGRLVGARWVAANASGGAMSPRYIVCHDTAGRTTKFSSVNWFASKECRTSAHFVVERDGTITQMVRTDRKAWHAGKSKWNGVVGLNSCSVGIEIVNPGKLDKDGKAWFGSAGIEPDQLVRKSSPNHGAGHWLPYTDAQIAAVKSLCRAICEEYPDCNEIVTHWMISPGRKIDTNPLFPWEEVQFSILDPSVEDGEDEIAPPLPVEKPVVKIPSPVKRAAESKTVWAKLAAMGAAIMGYFEGAMNWLSEKVDWLFGVPSKIKTDVDATLNPIQSLGQLVGANLKVILPTIAVGLIGVAIARHVRDTIEERKAKAELADLKGE